MIFFYVFVLQRCINMSSYRVKHREQWMNFAKTVLYCFKFTRSLVNKMLFWNLLYVKYVFPSISQNLLVQWSSLHQYPVLCIIWDCVGGCCDLVSLVLCVVHLLVYPVTVNFQTRNVLASSGHLEFQVLLLLVWYFVRWMCKAGHDMLLSSN